MSLTRLEDVQAHAGAIAFETRARHMPPWLPSTNACAGLKHSRALSEDDIQTLSDWADLGAPEGERATYVPPARPSTYGTLPPEPDRSVQSEAGYVPRSARGDDYRCFVLDPKLEQSERVIGVRVAPGAPAIVHHVLLFEVRSASVARVRALDAKDPGPGYGCFGGIGVSPEIRVGDVAKGELVDFNAQMVIGWAPGAGATDVAGAPTKLPDGTAIKLAAGSRLVMQVHYSLANGLGAGADRTRVDLWFARNEPLRQAFWVPILKYDFRVPAGAGADDPRATARAEVTLPFALTVRGVAPHMHLRGRTIRVETGEDDTASSCLLDVPHWDFHHQEGYWLEQPRRVAKAAVTCTWDNKTGTRELRWGEGTNDEMCLAFLYGTL
jgi:hypothetical protein